MLSICSVFRVNKSKNELKYSESTQKNVEHAQSTLITCHFVRKLQFLWFKILVNFVFEFVVFCNRFTNIFVAKS